MSFLKRVISSGPSPLLAQRFSASAQTAVAAGAAAQAAVAAAAAAPVTAAPSTVFVELGQASQQAAISRDGIPVSVVHFDPAALGTVLGQTSRVVAKVVSQSIQPGVSVAKGATVDLVLAEPASLNVSILQNAFQPLASLSLDAVYKNIVRDNAQVQSVLARNLSAAALSAQDQATLTTALTTASAPVTTDAGHTIDAAFSTLQAAFTFGT
jgi:hypothetical protein